MGQDRPSWPHPLGTVIIIESQNHYIMKVGKGPQGHSSKSLNFMQEIELSCLLLTVKIIIQFFWMDFDLPPSSPDHSLLSAFPSHWVKDFQEEISQQDQLLREIPLYPAWGRDKKQYSHPSSKIHLQGQQGGAASHLCSAQILHTGKCLSEDSSCPLHS